VRPARDTSTHPPKGLFFSPIFLRLIAWLLLTPTHCPVKTIIAVLHAPFPSCPVSEELGARNRLLFVYWVSYFYLVTVSFCHFVASARYLEQSPLHLLDLPHCPSYGHGDFYQRSVTLYAHFFIACRTFGTYRRTPPVGLPPRFFSWSCGG